MSQKPRTTTISRFATELTLACLSSLPASSLLPSAFGQDATTFEPTRFEKTTVAAGLIQPMEMAVAPDGTIYLIELAGLLKAINPENGGVRNIGKLAVTTEQENGLIGIALDPKFATNRWMYLQYSPPDFTGQHISRFTLKEDGTLDLES